MKPRLGIGDREITDQDKQRALRIAVIGSALVILLGVLVFVFTFGPAPAPA